MNREVMLKDMEAKLNERVAAYQMEELGKNMTFNAFLAMQREDIYNLEVELQRAKLAVRTQESKGGIIDANDVAMLDDEKRAKHDLVCGIMFGCLEALDEVVTEFVNKNKGNEGMVAECGRIVAFKYGADLGKLLKDVCDNI